MRKMKSWLTRLVLSIGVLILALVAWMGQRRTFYCISADKCVTIWKTYNNKSYIVPGKYYGVIEPSRSHVVATNVSSIAVIWPDDQPSILFDGGPECVIKNALDGVQFVDYRKNKRVYDSLYTFSDGTYMRYRPDLAFLTVDIKEGFTQRCETCLP
jgi:hypothetical protein